MINLSGNEKLWNLIETENLPAVRRRYRHELERRIRGGMRPELAGTPPTKVTKIVPSFVHLNGNWTADVEFTPAIGSPRSNETR